MTCYRLLLTESHKQPLISKTPRGESMTNRVYAVYIQCSEVESISSSM